MTLWTSNLTLLEIHGGKSTNRVGIQHISDQPARWLELPPRELPPRETPPLAFFGNAEELD